MTAAEIKNVLFQKLKDENCSFEKSDISVRQQKVNSYKITIADYSNIVFIVKYDCDDFGECMTLWRRSQGSTHKNLLAFEEGHGNEELKRIIVYLGYYIGTRF